MGPDADPHPSGEQKQGQRWERKKEGRGGERREFSLDRNNRTSHTIENLLLLLPARISQMTQLHKGPDTKGERLCNPSCECQTGQQSALQEGSEEQSPLGSGSNWGGRRVLGIFYNLDLTDGSGRGGQPRMQESIEL